MAQTVKLKRSNTAGTIPTTSNLALGEVAINTKDGKFFLRKHVDGSTGDAIHAYAPQGINAYGTQELVVKVVTKTTAHPNHGNGSSSGYTVQGLEGPFLALIPGNTYKFDVSDSTNSGHPFRFYLDAAKASAYTTGVTTSGSAGNSGAYVQIAVTTSTPQVLYYQCSSHSLMGSAAYVASDAIAANAVGTSQIAQNSITSSEIPNNSIGATQISAAVLAAKQDTLGNNSITAAMISQNTVGISELNVTDGSNGQVLTTNGSGTLSFANASSGTVTETFKTVSVSGQDDVVADGATDTLTLAAGSGMTITTNASSDTITFVSSASGIADDAVTTSKIADLNVTSAKLAANSVTSAKIATDAVGASEIAANSVGISELNVSDGSNGQVLTTNGSGTLSFATASGSVSEAFKTLSVSGQDDVVADSATDTLTFAAGSNMTISTNASNDTITFASSGSGGSSSSFAKNTFSGDGSTTAFTLTTSMSNEDGLIVFIDGVYQADNVYSVSGTTLTFATAPVNGRVIEVFQMEGGIVGTAPVLATMTGDGSDTTLALGTTPSSENQCFVTIDGVMQHKSTYSVSGSTLTFSTAPPNGTAVEAITLTNTSVATFQDSDGDTKIQMEESSDEDKIRFDTGGTERMIIDDAGRVGIGTSSPSSSHKLTVTGDTKFTGQLSMADSQLIKMGDSEDFAFYHDQSIGNIIKSSTSDMDIFIQGNDGGSTITALTLDMSNAGAATFNDSVTLKNTLSISSATASGFLQASSNVLQFGTSSDDPVLFFANNAEKMRLTSSGSVGIGESSPDRLFHVKRSDSAGTVAKFENSAGKVYIELNTNNQVGGDAGYISYDSSMNLGFWTDDTERVIIDSSGNLTVGVSTVANCLIGRDGDLINIKAKKDGTDAIPLAFMNQASGGTLAERLRISGNNLHLNGGTDARIQLGTGGAGANQVSNNTVHIRGDGANMKFMAANNGAYQYEINGTEVMRIGSNGNVAIGTTDTADVRLRVDQNENDDHTAFFKNTCAANAMVGVTFKSDNTVNAANKFGFQIDDNGSIRFEARMNGGIANYQGNDHNYSDERLKENITDSESTLDIIKNLKVRNFKYKDQEDNRVITGLIAQEVELVDSTLVSTATDGYKGIYTTDLYHKMLKAIQEQQTIIEDLKSRIETLEG